MISEIYFSRLLTVILLTALICDLWFAKIPNVVAFSGMVIGVIYYGAAQGLIGIGQSIAGLMIGGAVFLPFYLLKGMGAGDIKLMGAVGALVGLKGIIPAIVFTALAGGIYALGLIFFYPRALKKLILGIVSMIKTLVLAREFILPSLFEKGKKPQVRYGVAIAAGTLFSQWWWPLLK